MKKGFINIKQFLYLCFMISISKIYTKSLNESSSEDRCKYGHINTNGINFNEFNENSLKKLIDNNFNIIVNNKILTLFKEDFQIYIFTMLNCTNFFLYPNEIENNNLTNILPLFSVEGEVEFDSKIIKLVLQTKKEFKIYYFDRYKNRIINYSDDTKYYIIKTNIFPYFRKKLLSDDEYEIFKNEDINIFNKHDKIFNDICFKFETYNITKSPILRKSLYFYKNDDLTYPLPDSNNNCFIYTYNYSYEKESFILEYKCKRIFNISANETNLNELKGISIINREERETYDGPNNLKDQKEILKCHKKAFNSTNIRNNVGFYISLFLILVVFICLVLLITQKYESKIEIEPIFAPPKKKTLKEALKEKKDKKNVNFGNVEVIDVDKKKKKKKKKKQIISSDNEGDNEDNDNDLNWYSNSLELDEEKENDDIIKEENDFYKTDKPKKKKKLKKKKKGKKIKKNIDEDISINNSYDNKDNNNNDTDFNIEKEENFIKNKTISKFPSAYKQFQINSVNIIKQQLNLRRLVIITNLGNNYNKNNIYANNNVIINKEVILKNKPIEEKEKSSESSSNDIDYNNINIKNSRNNIVSLGKDSEIKEMKEEDDRIEKLGYIIGEENDGFLSNIMRDYLNFEDATYFDRRDNCKIFCHFMRLKNDLINMFYVDYSFTRYTIRVIKFAFFFHFMFYIETLCIGQKYYFDKYYSDEFQDFLENNHFYENIRNINYSNTNVSYATNKTFLEKYYNTARQKFNNIHYLYTFKYSFPRVLIPAAISLISYIFTSILSPRRSIIKILLNTSYKPEEKDNRIGTLKKKYDIIFLIFGILALLLMVFFFYSTINYFYVFDEAKYDIPQSFLLSGLVRFIFDIIFWAFIVELRVCSIQTHFGGFYNLINKIYEIN